MIEHASPDDADGILAVINTSDQEAYRPIIAGEHFVEPIFALDKPPEDVERLFSGTNLDVVR